jgi:hypothetical protein
MYCRFSLGLLESLSIALGTPSHTIINQEHGEGELSITPSKMMTRIMFNSPLDVYFIEIIVDAS